MGFLYYRAKGKIFRNIECNSVLNALFLQAKFSTKNTIQNQFSNNSLSLKAKSSFIRQNATLNLNNNNKFKNKLLLNHDLRLE